MSGLLSPCPSSVLFPPLDVLLFDCTSVLQVSILSCDPFPLACSFSYTPFAKSVVEAKVSFQILSFFVLVFFSSVKEILCYKAKRGLRL